MLREQAAATSSGPPSGVDIDKFLEEQGIAGVNKVCILFEFIKTDWKKKY